MTGPCQVPIEKITIPNDDYGEIDSNTLSYLKGNLRELNANNNMLNALLPIACLAEEKGEYLLLTGFHMFHAALAVDMKTMWLFVVADTINDKSGQINIIWHQYKMLIGAEMLESQYIDEIAKKHIYTYS